MIEVLRHSFGFCGEHWQPNVFNTIEIMEGLFDTTIIAEKKHNSRDSQYLTP